MCVCVACLWPLHFIFFSCHLLRIGSPDLLKLTAEHRTHLFICFFSRSFVAGVKNPSGILSPCVCLYTSIAYRMLCVLLTQSFSRIHIYTQFPICFGLWQTINPVSQMPCRQNILINFVCVPFFSSLSEPYALLRLLLIRFTQIYRKCSTNHNQIHLIHHPF